MARRNLEVIVTVRDAASKPLDDVANKMRNTGKAAGEANMDFTKFNRTLFTTTAFVGTFIKMFSSLSKSIEDGAELDRVESQYERVLGPKGSLLSNIRGLTDTAVDRMEAMRAGIQMANLGIARNSQDVAQVIAMSSAAARQAGMDSGEGIKRVTEFLKSGSISQLEFLNVIKRTNPALQAQMAILSKAGGTMGQVVSTQQRLAIGMAALKSATHDSLFGFRDLQDVTKQFNDSFGNLQRTTGRFLGAALGPLIDKLSMLMDSFANTLDNIRKNEKNLVFLAKAIVITTGSVLGLAGALGTLRLASMALTSLGLGLPRLMALVLGLGSVFLGVTANADSFMDKLKVFGAFVQGIYQMITSLDSETGIAKIDKDIKDLLEKNGIFTLAQNVSRTISVIKTVIKDGMDAFASFAKFIDNVFGSITGSGLGFLGKFKSPWKNFWVSESLGPIEKVTRAVVVLGATIGGLFLGKKLLGGLGGLLSKIPVIGKFFGGGGIGGGGGPKGTSNDPIYTAPAGVGAGLLGKAAEYYGVDKVLSKGYAKITAAVAGKLVGISMYFDIMKNTLATGFANIGKVLLPFLGPALGLAIAAGVGAAIGAVINIGLDKFTQGKTSEGFEGNIVERAMFKMFGSDQDKKNFSQVQDFENSDNLKLVNDFRAKQGKAPLDSLPQSTGINIPSMPSSELDKVDSLGEQLKTLKGADQKAMQSSVENALSSNSDMGGQISPEEWMNSMTQALDRSKNLSILAGKAVEQKTTVNPNSRR